MIIKVKGAFGDSMLNLIPNKALVCRIDGESTFINNASVGYTFDYKKYTFDDLHRFFKREMTIYYAKQGNADPVDNYMDGFIYLYTDSTEEELQELIEFLKQEPYNFVLQMRE